MTVFIVIGVIVGVIVLLGIWCAIEQKILRTRRETIKIEALPVACEGMKIFFVSDFHHRAMGKCNSRVVRCACREKPDFVVIAGDLVSRDVTDLSDIETFLRNLRAICPVYLSLGNHELDLPKDIYKSLCAIITATGCRLLRDETIKIERQGKKTNLALAGIALRYDVYKNEAGNYKNLASYTLKDMTDALGEKKYPTLLLAHNPFFMETYAAWGADLVFAGHVHGGAVRLPFIGGILSPERRFFPRYDKGYYRKDKTQMLVSGGIGKLRLFNPPELSVVKLEKDD